MSDTTTQAPAADTTTVVVPCMSTELAVTVGKTVVNMSIEAAMVMGGKSAGQAMADIGNEIALKKCAHGNYRAAAEIIGFAASASIMSFLAPAAGKTWTKAAVAMLAEKTLAQVPKAAKGWTAKQLKGRNMAQAVEKLFAATPAQ